MCATRSSPTVQSMKLSVRSVFLCASRIGFRRGNVSCVFDRSGKRRTKEVSVGAAALMWLMMLLSTVSMFEED